MTTALFPKSDNTPLFTGACTDVRQFVDEGKTFAPDVVAVKALGSDGEAHATWKTGDLTCELEGL